MNDIEYLITIIALTIIILIFGGKKYHHKLEYGINKFYNLQKLEKFSNKFQEYKKTSIISLKILDTIIPNIEKITVVYLKPNELYNVNNHCNQNFNNKCLMVIYDYDNINNNNLELLVSKDDNNNEGLFYKIEKNITITHIHSIYNNSSKIINFALILILKPHWFV